MKVIHIAERDTQTASVAKQPGEFVNTWSIDGFVGEGCQPAELGWGTHERTLPADGRRHDFGGDAAIYLLRPGASTRVRTWTPMAGPIHGFLITHNESISIADYYSVIENGTVRYRPTVHYAYHPCDDAVLSVHEMAGRNWRLQPTQRLMMDEITTGVDELGVLLMGHSRGAYWYGSRLSIEQARALAPHNNATSLQVTAAVLGGMVWAIENPRAGIVEADQLDHARVLAGRRTLPRGHGRGLQRLDPAAGPRTAVPGGCRRLMPMAIRQFSRGVTASASYRATARISFRTPSGGSPAEH